MKRFAEQLTASRAFRGFIMAVIFLVGLLVGGAINAGASLPTNDDSSSAKSGERLRDARLRLIELRKII